MQERKKDMEGHKKRNGGKGENERESRSSCQSAQLESIFRLL
jgi:hypothetical protein